MDQYDYDVALSFAGENRDYVEQVANYLKDHGVRVFYDRYEQASLWGKNLNDHLSALYRDRSRYVVIFISKYYVNKIWTNHERQSAQARALHEKCEYILPARFDNTEIPGIFSTTAYIDISNLHPEQFGKIIEEKLGRVDFWTEQARAAATYVQAHLFPCHRGAFLWTKNVTVIFTNDGDQLGHTYIRSLRKLLDGSRILAEARSDDGYSLAMLIQSTEARKLFELKWSCFSEEFLATGGHREYAEVQSNVAFERIASYFDVPAISVV